MIRWAAAVKGIYWYIAPFYNQAKKIVWEDPEMLPKYVPPSIWEKRNNSDLTIPFPNGSRLYILGADHPDSLRGPNPLGVGLDEFDDMRMEVWPGIIQPIMTSNPKSWCWFSGTPKGKKELYKKYMYGLESGNPNWFSSRLKASESGLISKEALEEARKTSTEAFYNQEYECDFIENAGQFFRRVRQNSYEPNQLTKEVGQSKFRLGADLAKYNDWTVLTPFNLNTFIALEQERFNQVEWSFQKKLIEAAVRRFNNAELSIDRTGVGDPIVEDLSHITPELNILFDKDERPGIHFTEQTRLELLQHLALLLEQDKIKIPNDEGLLNELESCCYQLGERGKVKIGVPEGLTDDRIMSLALAVYGLTDRYRPDVLADNHILINRIKSKSFK